MPFDMMPDAFDALRDAFDAAKKAGDRVSAARAAYEHASGEDGFDRWREVADLLALALPKARAGKPAGDDAASATPYAKWCAPPRSSRVCRDLKWTVAEVVFADGSTVRAYAIAMPGKPWDIGTAARAASEKWRARHYSESAGPWHGEVPEIVAIKLVDCGTAYDPADANRETEAARAAIPVPTIRTPPEKQRAEVDARLAWFIDPEACRWMENDRGRARKERHFEEAFALQALRDVARSVEIAPDDAGIPEPVEPVKEAIPSPVQPVRSIPSPFMRRLLAGTSMARSGAIPPAFLKAA